MDIYTNIAANAMNQIFNKTPQGFQNAVIPHLLRMLSSSIPKQPVLMVQPTGAGKSAVPLTVAVVDGGITLVIENTLALGTDQATKTELIARSTNRKFVKSIHLDSIKSHKQQRSLSSSIVHHCLKNQNTSIVIFTSPETLLKPIWIEFFNNCHKNRILNLVCIDEIHMFVEFGITFRPSFQSLRHCLFEKIQINETTSDVPILLMTAKIQKRKIILIQ